MRSEQTLKKILTVCVIIYIGTLCYSFYHNWCIQDYEALSMGIVAVLTPLIVPVLFKLFRFKPVYEIYIISTIFIYFASLIGSTFHWYSYLGFDKVLHFFSGVFAALIAVILFFYIRKSNTVQSKEDRTLMIVFMNAVNLAIAVLWEFYEYAILVLFNNDAINHYTQGVRDSMTDMLCALVGGLLLTACIIHAQRNKKENFFTNIYQKFYQKNLQSKSET